MHMAKSLNIICLIVFNNYIPPLSVGMTMSPSIESLFIFADRVPLASSV